MPFTETGREFSPIFKTIIDIISLNLNVSIVWVSLTSTTHLLYNIILLNPNNPSSWPPLISTTPPTFFFFWTCHVVYCLDWEQSLSDLLVPTIPSITWGYLKCSMELKDKFVWGQRNLKIHTFERSSNVYEKIHIMKKAMNEFYFSHQNTHIL